VISAGVSAGLAAALWLPTIVQELREQPGNLTNIVDWFRDPSHPSHTLGEGFHIVVAQFGISPEWLTRPRVGNVFIGETPFIHSAPLPWLALLFAAATYVCWRRRDRAGLQLAFVVTLAFVIGVFAVAQISGIMYAYRLRWTWLFGMLAIVLVVWTGWKELERRYPAGAARNLAPIALALIATVSVATVVGVVRADDPQAPLSGILGRVALDTKDALPPGPGDVIVDSGDPLFTPGLFLALERQGVPARVAVDPYHFFGDGTQRLHSGGPVRATLFVAIDKDVDRFWRAPKVRLLSYWGTVPIDQRERIVDEIQRRQPAIDDAFAAGRLTAEEHLLETARLERMLPSAPGTTVKAVGVFLRNP
jgi:hypothetical protein